MTSTTTSKIDAINAMIVSADEAASTLESTRREVSSDFNERIRKLRDFKIQLRLARSDETFEALNLGKLVTPEIARVLANPTYGLI